MAITANELIFRKPKWNSDSQRGGPMSTVAYTTGQRGNVFSDLTEAELASGETVRRKVFIHAAHSGVLPLVGAKVALSSETPLSGRVRLIPGTQRDLESDLTGTERIYGIGTLASASNPTQITVDVETGAGADDVFQTGDTIRIWTTGGGEIATVQAVAWTGDQAVIDLTASLTGTYSAGDFAASCIMAASIAPEIMDVITAGSVQINASSLTPDGLGSLEEIVTLTFSSPTGFSAVSDLWGSLGSGVTTTDFAPTNSAYGVPRWTIPVAAWTVTAEPGDTVQFSVHPAAIGVWMERITPAGNAAGDDNTELWIGAGS